MTNELHRGTFVTPLDDASVRDHYDLFGLVYGFAVRRALARDTKKTLAARLADVHRQLAATEDVAEISPLALTFQTAVASAASSPPTKVLLQSMSGWVPGNFFATEVERDRAQGWRGGPRRQAGGR